MSTERDGGRQGKENQGMITGSDWGAKGVGDRKRTFMNPAGQAAMAISRWGW